MARSRSRTNNILFAIGLISSAAALTASYLYFTSSLGDAQASQSAATRNRRKVIISSSSIEEMLRIIPGDAVESDEIYITLLHTISENLEEDEGDEFKDRRIEELEDRCSYLLHHQKGQGLTHIVRHVAPTCVIIAPSMVRETKIDEIKDWVGTVIVVGNGMSEGNIKYISSTVDNVYQKALSM